MRSIPVGGIYYRVADPRWDDPLDPSHAAMSGQRWNPPGLPCLYLNEDKDTARSICQLIGAAAHDAGLDGLASRSATEGGGRELAWFPRKEPAVATDSLAFDTWW